MIKVVACVDIITSLEILYYCMLVCPTDNVIYAVINSRWSSGSGSCGSRGGGA